MARGRLVVVAVLVLMASLSARPAEASGPSISFTASFCQPIPPASLPAPCATSNGGPGQSYNIVLSWSTNSDQFPRVYIFDKVGWQSQSGHTAVLVTEGGHYRYTLQMTYQGSKYFQEASVDVPDLASPVVTPYADGSSGSQIAANPFIASGSTNYADIKTGVQPKVSWAPGASPPWAPTSPVYTSIVVNPNFLTSWPPASSATSHLIPNSEFQSATAEATYNIRSCVDTQTTPAFCSAKVPITADLTGATFQGGNRQYVPVGGSATVSWSNPAGQATPGNYWVVVSQTLPNGGVIANTKSYQIPTPAAGVVDVWLQTCKATSLNPPASTCAGPNTTINAPASGIIGGLPDYGRHVLKDSDSGVTITNGSTVTHINATNDGLLAGAPGIANGSTVTSGQPILNILTQPAVQELVVGSGPVFTSQPWTNAFSQSQSKVFSTVDAPGVGAPTETATDASGNVFFNSEFSTALGKVDPTKTPPAAVQAYQVPLAHSTTQNGLPYFPPTTPFDNSYSNNAVTSTSAIGEPVIYAGGRIWAAQGGGFIPSNPAWNHSRIVSFDPTGGTLDPTIPGNFSKSFCAYSVPGNDNEIYDLAWDGHRIWFSEYGTGSISWFDPTQVQCDSMLDYTPVTGSTSVPGSHTTCPTGTPNCMHTVPACSSLITVNCIPEGPNGIVKLAADPDPSGGNNNHIWYGGYDGALGGVTYDSQGTLTSVQDFNRTTTPAFPAPAPENRSSVVWKMDADQQNVYMVESNDQDLVKFNKATQTFSEIHLPTASQAAYVLSIGLFNNKLYFLIQGGWGSGATLGYVDVDNWNAGTPTGVLYTGLPVFNVPGNAQLGPSAFDGLSFNSSNGAIAFSDFRRRQIYVLHP